MSVSTSNHTGTTSHSGGSQSSRSSHGSTATHSAKSSASAKSSKAGAKHSASKSGAKATGHTHKSSFHAAPSAAVKGWISQAQAILTKAGVPMSKMNANQLAALIAKESSNNPKAVNHWDKNAKAGHPSKGLMQTIQPTFDKYKLPGHNDITNPVDNIVAGVRYAVDRYGSISNVPGVRAMAAGHSYVGY